MFFYNSKNDEIIPAADADDWYNVLCERGVSVEYEQDLLGGHYNSSWDGFLNSSGSRTASVARLKLAAEEISTDLALTPEGIEGLNRSLCLPFYVHPWYWALYLAIPRTLELSITNQLYDNSCSLRSDLQSNLNALLIHLELIKEVVINHQISEPMCKLHLYTLIMHAATQNMGANINS